MSFDNPLFASQFVNDKYSGNNLWNNHFKWMDSWHTPKVIFIDYLIKDLIDF